MLPTTQTENGIAERPRFVRAPGGTRIYEPVLRAAAAVHQSGDASGVAIRLGDVDEPSPEELLHRYLSVRDELAYRRLRGEVLTLRESIVLEVLNRVARLVMPRPERLPDDVREAIDEVRRLRARRRSG